MSAAVEVMGARTTTLTAQDVADLVTANLQRGMLAQQAAEQVIEHVRQMGLQDALIDTLGPRAVLDLWVRFRPEVPKSESAPTPIRQQQTTPTQSTRRVDVERLKQSSSLLEGMYQVGERWFRLGDMDKSTCRAAAQQFKAKAFENAHSARYFHEIAKTLNGGETVRQRFDDAGLMRLWDVAGQGG